jgi:glycosyltransferase involved in cell wall biosynthesis
VQVQALARTPSRLVYLSPVPLGSFAQRPHHFVHWFHERFGASVLWIDPGPSRLPRFSDWPRLLRWLRGGGPVLGPEWQQADWLQHLAARVLPLEPWPIGRLINRWLWRGLLRQVDAFVTPDTVLVMAKPCALSLHLAERYPHLPLVFDAMDSMPAFCTGVSRRWMEQAEADLAERADRLWASSHALAAHHACHAHKTTLLLNGLSLPAPQPALEPVPVPPSGGPPRRPVLGYLGVIDHWFDWDLLIRLAEQHPEADVRLVGPVRHAAPRELPPNVQQLPAVPQHQVYEVLRGFDAGLIPFARDAVTEHVDPVKYYEYRALGLPVLSTRFGEMAERGRADGVHFFEDLLAQNAWADASALQALLADRPDAQQTQAFCREHHWGQRFEAVAASLAGAAQAWRPASLDHSPGSVQ